MGWTFTPRVVAPMDALPNTPSPSLASDDLCAAIRQRHSWHAEGSLPRRRHYGKDSIYDFCKDDIVDRRRPWTSRSTGTLWSGDERSRHVSLCQVLPHRAFSALVSERLSFMSDQNAKEKPGMVPASSSAVADPLLKSARRGPKINPLTNR